MSDDIAVGIDLGTSYSCVAAMLDGAPQVIPNEWGEHTHASVVSFLPEGTVLVGNSAKKSIITNAQDTVYSAKRLIGRFFFSDEVKKAQAVMPYKIVEGPNNSVRIGIGDRVLAIPEISAFVLKEMKAVAETALGREVRKAVVTCPAYFNDNQRQATRDAGRIAGLEVLRIINEPTAAALAYGFGKDIHQKICVYDLGGGTFDVSILEIGKDVFEVLATAGDTYLGGDDFDDRIMSWLAEGFLKAHQIDLRQNKFCLQMLKEASEKAKIDVGRDGTARILVPGICQTPEGEVLELTETLGADQFNRMVMDLVQRTFKVCDEALQSARFTASDIDAVILVGGPTRLPVIRNSVRHYFQREPMTGIDPDQVVALGASIQASALLNAGAAVSGQGSYLLDVTPLTLRVGTVGGFTERIIDRNTPIPIEKSKTFTTSRDGQERVKIRVYQGESNRADECEMLGEFEFAGFRIGYRGEVQIQVTFEIDPDGIVNVSATDLESGQRAATTISLSSGLSEQDIRTAIDKNAEVALAGHSGSPSP
ncbi:MAG: molecular chaperone DnaK [Anaeromyxobacter sp. RBG_16_69_14]|nr:MAG: molecular chaperone DnaK [Anaeromyxobacter sp. RBG_16_69_14]